MTATAELLTSKIPPHSLETERAVLGVILLERDSLPRAIEILKPADFYKEGHRRIFAAMIGLFERSEPVDLLTLTEDLRRSGELDEVGGPAALAGLVEEAALSANLAAYCAIVRERSVMREFIDSTTKLVGRAFNGNKAPDLLALAEELASRLRGRLAQGALPREDLSAPLGIGTGQFLAQSFAAPRQLVEVILSDDGGGWLSGEEKLGKTYYALEEALCLALGLPVCGRFAVPERQRVLVVEEEDPPRRTHRRLRALLRGHGYDPDNADLRAELDGWLRISVWEGFTFDDSAMVARLEAALREFEPVVCYVDVLRKVTLRDLNKAAEAGALLAILETLRRRYGVVFRIVAHYRKVQGFRVGRGSQEISGSHVLGAWGENSLFFEPVGRKQGAVRVEMQSKDNPPQPAFRLRIEAEGPLWAPERVHLLAEPEPDATAEADELVFQALGSLPPTDAKEGAPGVSVKALAAAVKRSEKTVRRALDRLLDAERILVTGTVSKHAKLYAVNA